MSVEKEVILHGKTFELFLEKTEVIKAIKHLANQINEDHAGESIVVLGVLDGVFMVLADLLRRLNVSVSLELVKLKSYKGMQSTQKVEKLIGLTSELSGKKILIVEDIVDTGETLSYLLQELKKHNVASIEIATLLLKPEIFKERFPIKYVGIEIINRFVVGYGMDYDGEGRQLPNVYALKESDNT